MKAGNKYLIVNPQMPGNVGEGVQCRHFIFVFSALSYSKELFARTISVGKSSLRATKFCLKSKISHQINDIRDTGSDIYGE
jgi:hypothetical protein